MQILHGGLYKPQHSSYQFCIITAEHGWQNYDPRWKKLSITQFLMQFLLEPHFAFEGFYPTGKWPDDMDHLHLGGTGLRNTVLRDWCLNYDFRITVIRGILMCACIWVYMCAHLDTHKHDTAFCSPPPRAALFCSIMNCFVNQGSFKNSCNGALVNEGGQYIPRGEKERRQIN